MLFLIKNYYFCWKFCPYWRTSFDYFLFLSVEGDTRICILLFNLNNPPFIPIVFDFDKVVDEDEEEDGFLFPEAVEHLFISFGTNAWWSNEDLEEELL